LPAEELELIQRSLNGDLEAWGEIVSRYKEAVFAVTLSILRNYADAEDATQDAFIRAYQNLPQIRSFSEIFDLAFHCSRQCC